MSQNTSRSDRDDLVRAFAALSLRVDNGATKAEILPSIGELTERFSHLGIS